MTATLDRGNALEGEPGQLGGVPDWFNASRQAGWKRFQELPMPSRKDEEWRFAGLRHLDFEGVQLPDPQSMGRHRGASGLEKRAARIGFVNDGLNEQEFNLPDGVVCLPLRRALEEHPDLLQ